MFPRTSNIANIVCHFNISDIHFIISSQLLTFHNTLARFSLSLTNDDHPLKCHPWEYFSFTLVCKSRAKSFTANPYCKILEAERQILAYQGSGRILCFPSWCRRCHFSDKQLCKRASERTNENCNPSMKRIVIFAPAGKFTPQRLTRRNFRSQGVFSEASPFHLNLGTMVKYPADRWNPLSGCLLAWRCIGSHSGLLS